MLPVEFGAAVLDIVRCCLSKRRMARSTLMFVIVGTGLADFHISATRKSISFWDEIGS
jgi:hypothetical protein